MLIIAAFVDIVHSSNGTTQRLADDNSLKNDNTKLSRTNKKVEKCVSIIPSHLMKTDVSGLKGETLIFANMIFCILSCVNLCQLHLFYKTNARKLCKVGDCSLSYLDFVNIPSSYNLEYFHKLVVENGGSFSMNLNESVTHCIAVEKRGIYLCFRRSLFFNNGILNTYGLKSICMLTFQV